jgi:anti-anti-sigma factor
MLVARDANQVQWRDFDAPLLSIDLEGDGTMRTVRLRGEICYVSAPSLGVVGTWLCLAGVRHITVDLSDVTFLDAAGVGAFLTLERMLVRQKGTLALCNARRGPRRVLDLCAVPTVDHDAVGATRSVADACEAAPTR